MKREIITPAEMALRLTEKRRIIVLHMPDGRIVCESMEPGDFGIADPRRITVYGMSERTYRQAGDHALNRFCIDPQRGPSAWEVSRSGIVGARAFSIPVEAPDGYADWRIEL